jgi:hypothetical protein
MAITSAPSSPPLGWRQTSCSKGRRHYACADFVPASLLETPLWQLALLPEDSMHSPLPSHW